MTRISHVLLAAAVLLLASCAYPSRNTQLADTPTINGDYGYRWSKLTRNQPADTLVVVTASGGGTRAATLTLGVLEALERIQLRSGGTLARRIDVLSSVSGGSVTAGYFALKGPDGFPALERFVRSDGVSAILLAGLNPVGLARLSTPGTERIDLLIDYFDRTLFTDKPAPTYDTLDRAGRGPLLILNAADMVEGVPFAFTQPNFDLLCSDMSTVKLSVAVAASAAFPAALSPVTLKNYSPCPAQPRPAAGNWLPAWASGDVDTSWDENPSRAMRGRVEQAYALGGDATHPKAYIHLLDGGIADNLGVAEPYLMLTTEHGDSTFLSDIANGNYKKIVFIVINARSFATSDLDAQQATPGIIDMLGGTIASSIDNASGGTGARLRKALTDDFLAEADRNRRNGDDDLADNLENIAKPQNTQLIEIDFDAIRDGDCRRDFHNIGTSWRNSGAEINGLLLVGPALLGQAPAYGGMLAAVGGTYSDVAHQDRLPDMTAACDALHGRPTPFLPPAP